MLCPLTVQVNTRDRLEMTGFVTGLIQLFSIFKEFFACPLLFSFLA